MPSLGQIPYGRNTPLLEDRGFWIRSIAPFGFGTVLALGVLSRWDMAISDRLNHIFRLQLSFVSFGVLPAIASLSWTVALQILAFVALRLLTGRRVRRLSPIWLFIFGCFGTCAQCGLEELSESLWQTNGWMPSEICGYMALGVEFLYPFLVALIGTAPGAGGEETQRGRS